MNRAYRQGTGKIVGKTVKFENGEIGTVTRYDRIDKTFVVEMNSDAYKSKFNPLGIVYATREEFEIIEK